jgi:hypothetical protein
MCAQLDLQVISKRFQKEGTSFNYYEILWFMSKKATSISCRLFLYIYIYIYIYIYACILIGFGKGISLTMSKSVEFC